MPHLALCSPQILQVALDYARLMLQLKQASWAPPALAAALAETPAEQQQQQVVIEDEPIVFSFGEPSASGAARSVTTVATEAVDGSVAAAAAIGGEAAVAVLGSEQEAGPGSLGLTYMYGEQEQQVGSVEALQEHVSSLQGELQQQWGEVQERLNQQLGPEAGVGPEAAGHWQVPHAAAQAMTLEERLAAQAAEAETEARRQVGRAPVGVCCKPCVSRCCVGAVAWDAGMARWDSGTRVPPGHMGLHSCMPFTNTSRCASAG